MSAEPKGCPHCGELVGRDEATDRCPHCDGGISYSVMIGGMVGGRVTMIDPSDQVWRWSVRSDYCGFCRSTAPYQTMPKHMDAQSNRMDTICAACLPRFKRRQDRIRKQRRQRASR